MALAGNTIVSICGTRGGHPHPYLHVSSYEFVVYSDTRPGVVRCRIQVSLEPEYFESEFTFSIGGFQARMSVKIE